MRPASKLGGINEKERYGIAVFIETGIVSGLTGSEELQPMIHHAVWENSIPGTERLIGGDD